jgi:molybdopterin synthase sulfur carrier subunit
MATLKLFGNLRQIAGKSSLAVKGQTVSELLESLRPQQAALVDAILDEAQLKSYYKIMVNGIDITLQQGLDTAVHDSDVVAIFPPIAGGIT